MHVWPYAPLEHATHREAALRAWSELPGACRDVQCMCGPMLPWSMPPTARRPCARGPSCRGACRHFQHMCGPTQTLEHATHREAALRAWSELPRRMQTLSTHVRPYATLEHATHREAALRA